MASHLEPGPDDPDRLRALRSLDILDTGPEPQFDDIVAVAAALCDAPVALVSLVDQHRQWFKARVGLDLQETPIEQAVCAHAIRQRDVLVIPDLMRDPRTAANALVTAADGIRFYAGAPLVTTAGDAIGTLCVIDWKPRPEGLPARQHDGLRALARQTVAAIEARRASLGQASALRRLVARARDVAERDVRARSAQEAGRIGTFELDVRTDEAQVSPEFCRLFGLPVRPVYAFERLEALMVPGPDAVFSTRASRADGTAPLDVEYRIRRVDDGQVRWLARRAAFERDAGGAALRMFGTLHDVTERRVAGERMEALLRLGDRLRGGETIDLALTAVAETLCDALHVARAGYALVDFAAGTVTIVRDCARGVPSLAGTRALGSVAAMADGETRVFANVAVDPAAAEDREAYREIGTQARISVPLIDRGKLVGVVFVHDRVPRAWDALEVEFVEGVADRAHAAIARLRAEEERTVLNHELGHRLKNMMTLIQAIANQTLRAVPERAPVEALERRLVALGGAHDVLLRKSWTGARIKELLTRVIAMTAQEERVALTGRDIAIGARAALGMSLLIHELLTNAVKYGALSADAGRIEIAWRANGDDAFTLAWIERGGPPATEPVRKSFGTRLISLGLLGTGGASLSYRPAGLEARFTASLASIVSG